MNSHPSRTITLLGFTALIACVLAVLWPCAMHGFPRGADADFHATAWSDVAQQWHEGTIWPRWGAKFAFGFGEPVYIFYPPFSIVLGALCVKLLGGGTAPFVFCFVTLLLAGWNMRSCARDYTDEVGAWIAACAYAANPYFMICIWIRNSFAELLAAALFPLVMKYSLKLETRRDFAKLALAYAAIWLTNFPAAVITSYAIVVLLIVRSIDEHRWIRLIRGVAAMSLGIGVAAWTILPAWYEQRWVKITWAYSGYNLYWKHWLWGGGADKDDVEFTRWMTVAAASLIAIALTAVFARFFLRDRPKDSQLAIFALFVVSALMMFSASRIVWAIAPLLSKVQFPWRWMFVVAFTTAMLIGFLAERLPWTIAVAVVLIVSSVWVARYLYEQADWDDLWTKDYVLNQHYLVEEYLPIGADSRMLQWAAEKATRGTLNYPAWQVNFDDPRLDNKTHLLVSSPENKPLRFTRTWDRTLGGAISIIGFCVCGFLLRKK